MSWDESKQTSLIELRVILYFSWTDFFESDLIPDLTSILFLLLVDFPSNFLRSNVIV